MKRLVMLLAGAALVWLALTALGQQGGTTAAGGKDEQPKWTQEDLDFARAYYRELLMINLVQTMQLDLKQAQALVKVMETIQKTRKEEAKLDSSYYQGRHVALDNYIKTWVQYGFVPPNVAAPVAIHLQQYQAQNAPNDKAIGDATAFAYQEILTDDQRSAIETPEERLAKEAVGGPTGRGGGATFEEVMNQLLDARRVPQQEFEQQKEQVAERIAASIVGQGAEGLAAMRARVLTLLNEVRMMDAATFARQRADFEKKAKTMLGLDKTTETTTEKGRIKPDSVAQEAFETFLRDPRAMALLKRIIELDEKEGTK